MEKLTYITDYLERNATTLASKPAIIFNNKVISWLELSQTVTNASIVIAENLKASVPQKIVGILLSNSPEFIIAYLGAVRAGHIVMPLDPNFKQLEANNVIEQMKPDLIITDTEHMNYFSSGSCLDVKNLMNVQDNKEALEPLAHPADKLIVSMLFTSGTTGNPKATPYTHANHQWNTFAVSKLWNWTETDTLLISLPLSHWHGLIVGLTGSLIHGNTMYLQERFDPQATLEMLETGKISMFMHVPIAYSKIIEYKPEVKFDVSKVRLFISGSSFLPPAMWHKFKERFNQEILERYGASEMGFLTSNSLETRIPGCVGKPLEGVEIKIQESGEIAMKSPGLFLGYWNNQQATDEHITEDGLWLSGDIGEFDTSGNIHLKGRVQEKMKKFGYTVYPRDVEWALMQDSRIIDAVVISIQSETELNDKFVFFVVGDISQEQVFDISKTTMPNFWRPDEVMILDAIPRTGRANKPALKELRAMVS